MHSWYTMRSKGINESCFWMSGGIDRVGKQKGSARKENMG